MLKLGITHASLSFPDPNASPSALAGERTVELCSDSLATMITTPVESLGTHLCLPNLMFTAFGTLPYSLAHDASHKQLVQQIFDVL
ncbi:MAG: hypothetical protein VYC60_02695 [Candidatus Thermoplasmatota archaeon]|nr:hypothetical protein [Candidatus Thermoplasmatota archaeon]